MCGQWTKRKLDLLLTNLEHPPHRCRQSESSSIGAPHMRRRAIESKPDDIFPVGKHGVPVVTLGEKNQACCSYMFIGDLALNISSILRQEYGAPSPPASSWALGRTEVVVDNSCKESSSLLCATERRGGYRGSTDHRCSRPWREMLVRATWAP